MITINVIGVREFNAAMDVLVGKVELASRTATTVAAAELEREAKSLLGQQSHPPGTRTPSKAGEPPALVTGTLRRSIHTSGPTKDHLGRWTAVVGPTVIYGRIQELGGSCGKGHAARLPARPYMTPALEAVKPRLAEIYRSAWGRAVR